MVLGNLLYAVFKGKKAPANPYHSLGLEWQTTSPPIHDNFEKIPVVTDWTYGYGKPEGLNGHSKKGKEEHREHV